jgi:hypothetical protein
MRRFFARAPRSRSFAAQCLFLERTDEPELGKRLLGAHNRAFADNKDRNPECEKENGCRRYLSKKPHSKVKDSYLILFQL